MAAAVGFCLGSCVRPQSVYAVSNEASISEAAGQTADILTADDIFENYTQTSLKEQYDDKSVLEQLKQNDKIADEAYERAVDVLEGNAKFVPKREFSSEAEGDNKIDQVGDIAKYSQNELKCIWTASEIILTGIYGVPEESFNVFVDVDEEESLPYIIFSQNHGYYAHWFDKIKLKKGMNKIVFPTFGQGYISKDEIRGGAIYLCNPYFRREQGKVEVYIEGGGYYPVFRKDGNEREFLDFLAEYEADRKENNLLDMAELVTDHAIISTTSSSLYDVYFNNDVITPSKNLELWGNYFTTLFEFNGIPTSESSSLDVPYDPRNDHVRINFRYMTYYQGSGAYSYSYHIGWYYEHYWFANFYNAKQPIKDHGQSAHLLFGIGHELGHALDNEPRKINETTNNFTAAMAYFNVVGMPHHEQYQPFEKTLKALSNDYTLDYKAYDDGQIMYTKKDYPTNYDHNYLIWWDLEAVFPGFWAKFNNYFRGAVEKDLSMEEKYVYYSSLATKTDLSAYYERWGFYYGKSYNEWKHRFVYENSSERFKTLMKQAENEGRIEDKYDHFWYVDGAQYDFAQNHKNVSDAEKAYSGGTPSITKIVKANSSQRTVYIANVKDEYHLGYEVMSNAGGEWKLVGFTYGSTFADSHYYASDPQYKVVAINRYFYPSEESLAVSEVSSDRSGVCRIDQTYFGTLIEALRAATDGQTICLLSDCKLENFYVNAAITLEVDPSVQNDVCIITGKAFLQCHDRLTLKGRPNAKIVFDGNSSQSTTPVIYGSGGELKAENIVFRNLITNYLAGAIYAQSMDVELYDCRFENCMDQRSEGVIHAMKKVKMQNCEFVQCEEPCLNMTNIEDLTLVQSVSEFSVVFGDFDGVRNITLEGEFDDDVLKKIKVSSEYMFAFDGASISVSKLRYDLKFHESGASFDFELKSREFVFGAERQYELGENQYVEYEDRASGKKYFCGDKIAVDKDMEFDVAIKDKAKLKIYDKQGLREVFYPQNGQIYLPTADGAQNKISAYKNGDEVTDAGKVYAPEPNACLIAIYQSCWACAFYVDGEIYDVQYGAYGQTMRLPKLENEGFLGWQYDLQFVSDSVVLNGDADLVAVFEEDIPEIYELDKCRIQIDGSYAYTGDPIVPKITIYFNGLIVPEDRYTIDCSNNVSAGAHAEVCITSVQGLSTGSKTQTFTIDPKRLAKSDITVTGLKDFVYTGAETEQNLKISYKNAEIEDFSTEYLGDRINAGTVRIKIAFFGNFAGDVYFEYVISKADREDFEVRQAGWVYGEVAPPPTVTGLADAVVTYAYSETKDGAYTDVAPTKAGDYWIKATIGASQNYHSAEAKAMFVIEKADSPKIVPDSKMTVGRKTETLRAVPLADGWKWEKPETKMDAESIKAYAVYEDSANYKNFRIEITLTKAPRKDASNLSINFEIKPFVYDGTEKTVNIVVKDGDLPLVLGVDYDVQYQNNKNAGQATVIVIFKNDYSGTRSVQFTISQAENPNVDTTIHCDKRVSKLSDISLPDGFVWENGDMTIEGSRMSAKAVYKGNDASNYKTTELTFEIFLDRQTLPTVTGDTEQTDLIWLAVVVPAAALVIGLVVYAFVRHRRKKG